VAPLELEPVNADAETDAQTTWPYGNQQGFVVR